MNIGGGFGHYTTNVGGGLAVYDDVLVCLAVSICANNNQCLCNTSYVYS